VNWCCPLANDLTKRYFREINRTGLSSAAYTFMFLGVLNAWSSQHSEHLLGVNGEGRALP